MSASCEDICETIKKRVKEECFIPRYKLVCQVVLGEMKDQGVRVTSRCLWDPDSDNYASAYFKNVRGVGLFRIIAHVILRELLSYV